MRTVKMISLAAFLGMAAIASAGFINNAPGKTVAADEKGFAVVELYTSEGCSSCPPADDLISKIEKESSGKPVYILAYHVDYWNRLGWKDQFSSPEFSARQNEYANYLHLSSVYTPQIIVNGKTEFVGSEEGRLRNAIRGGLQQNASAQLKLDVGDATQGSAAINYNIEGNARNMILQIGIVQKSAVSNVTSGENGGRTLSHVQIVRKLQKVTLNGNNGAIRVSLPHEFNSRTWEIIGFLQNPSNGSITGASRAIFTDNTATADAAKSSKY